MDAIPGELIEAVVHSYGALQRDFHLKEDVGLFLSGLEAMRWTDRPEVFVVGAIHTKHELGLVLMTTPRNTEDDLSRAYPQPNGGQLDVFWY